MLSRSIFQEEMEDLAQISRCLYRLVGKELGTEKVVDMRRKVMALKQSLDTSEMINTPLHEDVLLSGSQCEGFRFASSDKDWMWICRDIRVMFSLFTEHQYNGGQTLLLAERNATKPGFVLLRLLNPSAKSRVTRACVPHEDGYYVGSQKWRDHETADLPYLTPHGPCGTTVKGTIETDFAYCIKSDKLPEEAHCFVRRLHRTGWPSTSTLQRIVSEGCHFVAIGAKESPTELIEWRISFSATEKILIHSMNHFQFLCYGLLKIFLKEAIDNNTEIKGLLCSYFLKTALFWEISTNSLVWNASNFLSCFWICFQRLLDWINNEYCPNFFIPENNMFAGKIKGAARSLLLNYLVPLYQEGYNCLLRCPSLQHTLYAIIHLPLLANMADTIDESEKCQVEVELIMEIWNSKQGFSTIKSKITKQIQDLENIIFTNDAELEQEILQLWRNYLIQNLSIISCIGDSVDGDADHSRQPSITTMPVIDATRHLLYTALYHYRRGMYIDAISLLHGAKKKLQHPHLIYVWTGIVGKYRAAGGEHKPFTQMMKEIVAWPVVLKTDVTIPELTLEHQAAASHSIYHIIVPPLVFTNFLCFLCYQQTGRIQEAGSALQELSILVQYDDSYHIQPREKAISWQILGICQEMSGDKQGAYQSYNNALQQEISEIGQASLMRIHNLIK